MNNERSKLVILTVLVVVMLIVWLLVLRQPSPSTSAREKSTMTTKVNIDKIVDKLMVEMKLKQGLVNLKSLVSTKSDFATLRNPFQRPLRKEKRTKRVVPKSTQTSVSPRVQLEGIMWDPQNPAAIINDEIVYEGSIIRGMRIVKIEPERVIGIYNGKKYILQVPVEQ